MIATFSAIFDKDAMMKILKMLFLSLQPSSKPFQTKSWLLKSDKDHQQAAKSASKLKLRIFWSPLKGVLEIFRENFGDQIWFFWFHTKSSLNLERISFPMDLNKFLWPWKFAPKKNNDFKGSKTCVVVHLGDAVSKKTIVDIELKFSGSYFLV